MKRAFMLVVLLAVPAIGSAKSETARIEIVQGKRTLVTLVGEESAGQFTIWSGPGTIAGPPGGPMQMTTSPRDFADWLAGAVEPPKKLRVYEVRFYCAARGENALESLPSSLCYGVRYGVDPKSGQGYIQIPPTSDAQFAGNSRSIYRGVEGNWYRSSGRWEEIVRPKLEAARSAAARDTHYQDPNVYRPPPSRTAVSAKPTVTPRQ
jgi:hypothetical protein